MNHRLHLQEILVFGLAVPRFGERNTTIEFRISGNTEEEMVRCKVIPQ